MLSNIILLFGTQGRRELQVRITYIVSVPIRRIL